LTSACQGGVDTFSVSAPCSYPDFVFPGTNQDYYAVWKESYFPCNGGWCRETQPEKIIASSWDVLKPYSVTLNPTGDSFSAKCSDGRTEKYFVYGNICEPLKSDDFKSTSQTL
jgi:hypothetical protein